MIGYYIRTIKGLAKISSVVETTMVGLKKTDKLNWTPELQTAFNNNKKARRNEVCLGRPFRLTKHASGGRVSSTF